MHTRGTPSLTPTIIAINVAIGVICVVLIVIGAVRESAVLGPALLIIGALGLILIGLSLPFALAASRGPIGESPASRSAMGTGSPASMQSLENLLAHIHENTMLSDNAKRVLFRERELELMRRAIEEDIAHGDYNSGLTLCDEMANVFGHREEAEAFRTRILQAGHASYEAGVQEAVEQFERVLATRDWAQAHGEAARIRRLYPNHHVVQEVEQRIIQVRDEHKRELEAQFLKAAERDDVETAMPLLKELDRYLTREEAGRLAQVAEKVVVKHRDRLGMAFKMAVNDHRWAEAAAIGDSIMRDYPNTKMADEVRAMIDPLRMRARQTSMAASS